jgi:hypothetical protein
MLMRQELPERLGRYRIVRKLGAGGMGAVYLAEDTQLGRQVALKVPHFDDGADPKIIERFYREARVAAAIEHPNLCPVYDVGQAEGVHYLTMPYINGVLPGVVAYQRVRVHGLKPRASRRRYHEPAAHRVADGRCPHAPHPAGLQQAGADRPGIVGHSEGTGTTPACTAAACMTARTA